ncbi:MAG: DUF305 domain-containing protein [Armatimonadota bacterium]|nr:DUF305 domain-containing protein [bacterium]
MRYLGITLLALMFAVAPIGVMAQCCPQTTCPEPCPAPCPTVCPEPCPTACPAPCPSACPTCPAEPASIGAGPCSALADLCGCDFDQAFMRLMYQQHSDVAALATQGIQLSTDKNIRDLSGKIRYEQTKQNEKLVMWAQKLNNCTLPVDYMRIQGIMEDLQKCCGSDYNIPYVKTMIGLLQQNRDAAQLAISKATVPGLRDQARIVVKSTTREIAALQSWLAKFNSACPTVCPTSTCPTATCPTSTCPTPCPTCP